MITSQVVIDKLYAMDLDDVAVVLLTLDHPTFDAPVRLSLDNKDTLEEEDMYGRKLLGTLSRGREYLNVDFEITLPSVSSEEAPHGSIRMDNSANELIPYIRNAQVRDGPLLATIELVFASDPDTVLQSWTNFEIREIKYDSVAVEASFKADVMAEEPYPGRTFNPAESGIVWD